MGSNPVHDPVAKRSWAKDEAPQDWVEVAAFQIGKYPVTVAEYALAVRADAVREPPETGLGQIWHMTWQLQLQHPDHPVVCVSWKDAMAYVAWLHEVTGQRDWQLPSDAQWEKAARWDVLRDVSCIYPWGDSFDQNRCNTKESYIGHTTPIGSYPARDARRSGASPYGVEEMAGNVWERTSSQKSTDNRTLRGGSWYDFAGVARAAYRDGGWWGLRNDCLIGFRLVFASSAGS